MAIGGGNERGAVRSEINVTPLVDVCLVLLIIFMVVVPLLTPGVDVVLPHGRDPAKMAEGPGQLVLALKVDGQVWYGSIAVSPDALRSRLREMHERSPGKVVILKADARLEYGDVKRMLKLINDCGFRDVGLLAQRERT
jgi:biopolymer transport protein TolR